MTNKQEVERDKDDIITAYKCWGCTGVYHVRCPTWFGYPSMPSRMVDEHLYCVLCRPGATEWDERSMSPHIKRSVGLWDDDDDPSGCGVEKTNIWADEDRTGLLLSTVIAGDSLTWKGDGEMQGDEDEPGRGLKRKRLDEEDNAGDAGDVISSWCIEYVTAEGTWWPRMCHV